MSNEELECVKDVILSNMKTQDIWFDISDGFVETLKEKDKEIERLKQGYCELKEKCNKGECDCTHEEYNGMCEQNIKMDLEIERLNNDIKELFKENSNKEKVIIAQDNIIKEVREKIKNFNVYEEFTFPLMTTEEEFQVKSSIDYEWRKSIKEPILEILDKENKQNEMD